MTTQIRKDLLQALEELGKRFPDVRFGQLVVNVCNAVLEPALDSIWDVEDADLLAAARQFLDELARRETAANTSLIQ